MTSIKKKISEKEFLRLQKQYPKVNLSKIYSPISEEVLREEQEWEEHFQVPEFLKKKKNTL